jgi:hypothetical protein
MKGVTSKKTIEIYIITAAKTAHSEQRTRKDMGGSVIYGNSKETACRN